MVTEQIEKYIEKYEDKETDLNYNANEFKLIGEFLTDLNALLKYAQDKQAACCVKKVGKQIAIASCRVCPYFEKNRILQDYCNHPRHIQIGGVVADKPDVIPGWCPL